VTFGRVVGYKTLLNGTLFPVTVSWSVTLEDNQNVMQTEKVF